MVETTQSMPFTWTQLGVIATLFGVMFTGFGVLGTWVAILRKNNGKKETNVEKAINNFTSGMVLVGYDVKRVLEIVQTTHKKTGEHEIRIGEAMKDVSSHMTMASETFKRIEVGLKENNGQVKESEQKLHEHLSRSKGEILKLSEKLSVEATAKILASFQ